MKRHGRCFYHEAHIFAIAADLLAYERSKAFTAHLHIFTFFSAFILLSRHYLSTRRLRDGLSRLVMPRAESAMQPARSTLYSYWSRAD